MPALLLGLALAAATATPPASAACAAPGPVLADAAPAQPRRLDQLPPAALYLAVDRRIDKCPAPRIIRTGIGSDGK
jgi:hypothetical protein